MPERIHIAKIVAQHLVQWALLLVAVAVVVWIVGCLFDLACKSRDEAQADAIDILDDDDDEDIPFAQVDDEDPRIETPAPKIRKRVFTGNDFRRRERLEQILSQIRKEDGRSVGE